MPNDFIKIVHLPPMRVLSFHSLGEHLGDPEDKAGREMFAWAKPRGLLDDPKKHQVFGFNNPDPPMNKEGGPEPNKPYGYEFWITVDEDFAAESDMNIKTVDGGMYAVITCRVESPAEIGRAWGSLIQWIQKSEKYTFHPNWKGLKSHYKNNHVEHGITGLENHLSLLAPPPKGKPWQCSERLIMDIYAPVIEKS
ncbi:MAG: GyrI-like domain-containing protein [Candidatus Bathyarchaeota archaeon]|nr:MAG: GyrI-like domain-containing protein [Candidatus Bathyarchaeota archaeon]